MVEQTHDDLMHTCVQALPAPPSINMQSDAWEYLLPKIFVLTKRWKRDQREFDLSVRRNTFREFLYLKVSHMDNLRSPRVRAAMKVMGIVPADLEKKVEPATELTVHFVLKRFSC